MYTNLLAHQPRGDNSPHRFQIATFRAFPAKLGKTHRMITERHPPLFFFKKNLVKIQNILQSVEMWARLKNSNIDDVSPSSAGRVRVFKSMRLHQSHIPIHAILFFYSSRSYKQTNMQWRHNFFKTLRNAMEILSVFFLENLAIRKPCYRKRQCTRCICK